MVGVRGCRRWRESGVSPWVFAVVGRDNASLFRNGATAQTRGRDLRSASEDGSAGTRRKWIYESRTAVIRSVATCVRLVGFSDAFNLPMYCDSICTNLMLSEPCWRNCKSLTEKLARKALKPNCAPQEMQNQPLRTSVRQSHAMPPISLLNPSGILKRLSV